MEKNGAAGPAGRDVAAGESGLLADASLQRMNAVLAGILCLPAAVLPPVLLILLFHYLDSGWSGGRYSPLGKVSAGLIRRRPTRPTARPARVRMHARLGLVVCAALTLLAFFAPTLPYRIAAIAWSAWSLTTAWHGFRR